MKELLFSPFVIFSFCVPSITQQYSNPVINYSLPDLTVIKADDGHYYLYTTENIQNLPIHRSKNMVNWSFVGTALTDETRPAFESKGSLWASDTNKIGSRYVIYYSMSVWGGEWICGIGVAVADEPEGLFTNHGKLFHSNEIEIQNCIDSPYVENGDKEYLFWGSFYGIYGAELNDDGLSLKGGVKPQQTADTAYEGTYTHKRGGYYYLFASIRCCCEGLESIYTTVAGWSRHLFGPYVDKKGSSVLENHHEVLTDRNTALMGPGHDSEVATDDRGADWMLYYAVSVANPEGGVLILDCVNWKKGWPVAKGNTPSL